MSDDFGQLIVRAQAGDRQAMEQLLEEYGDAIRREIRFCLLDRRLRRVVGDSDVFQSVVVKFAIGLNEGQFHFDSPKDLVSLLKVLARTHVAYLARFWHARRRDIRKDTGIDAEGFAEACTDDLMANRVVERTELLELALLHLRERDRQILDWRQDNVTWPEIAIRLNVSSSEALRKQHKRTLTRLAQELVPDDSLARHHG